MTLREATWRDAWRIWRWRNDSAARRWMWNTKRIGLLEHLRWFRRIQRDMNVRQYIALDRAAKRVGSARLDFRKIANGKYGTPLGTIAEVDVIIVPEARGQGWGRRVIKMAAELGTVRADSGVYAVIREGNQAALSAFKAAGFVSLPSGSMPVPFVRCFGCKVLRYEP